MSKIALVSVPDPNQPQHGSLPARDTRCDPHWGRFGSGAETRIGQGGQAGTIQGLLHIRGFYPIGIVISHTCITVHLQAVLLYFGSWYITLGVDILGVDITEVDVLVPRG